METTQTLRHTTCKDVAFGDDHMSEGFLVPLNDGKVMMIFRRSPGIRGDHSGTPACVARTTYDPSTDRWSKIDTVYNSNSYDDRNIHGGITRDGRIVVFFRSYNGSTVGRYFIYSDDQGVTWSDLQTSSVLDGCQGTGQMFFNPAINKYCTLQYTETQVEILYSDNGSSWDQSNIILEGADFEVSEIAGAWCGGNRMVALMRDDQHKLGHPLLQATSLDNGKTWSQLQPTNIPPDRHWGCAPQLYYDQKRDMIIALNSDRYTRPDAENALFVYTARFDDIQNAPQSWTFQLDIPRPWAQPELAKDRPLNESLYGYPTIAPIDEDQYLVVFTERARMHGTEQADLYYFRLIL
ncbi:sialidase family protein [Phycisphaerales bacterium AB-hyl4]|uniref:Sialidase family protein n=1 Tax=Natronomicrosphaera hydrolytica TaxID=3242702 RepID=A0ABV4U9J8_9BACT